MKKKNSFSGYLINNVNFINYNIPLMTGSALLAIFIFNKFSDSDNWFILFFAIIFIILAGLCRPMSEQLKIDFFNKHYLFNKVRCLKKFKNLF